MSATETDRAHEVENLARMQQKLEHEYTRWDAAKKYPKVIFYVACLLWIAISCGYEGQAAGIVVSIPTFRRDFGHPYGDGTDYVLDSQWQSAISGGPQASIFFGVLFGSWFADLYGRKLAIYGALVLSLGFIGIEFAATTIQVFFAGKFLNSFVLGIIQVVVTSHIAEIAPLALRGICVSAVNLSFCIGPFICFLIANTTSKLDTRMSYRALFISQWVFSGISLVLLWFVPESPYYFVLKNDTEKATKSLFKIYKEEALVQNHLSLIEQTAEESKSLAKSGSFLTLFNKTNLKRSTAAISMCFMMAMCGLPYIYSYATYYYQLAGFSDQQSFQISIGGQVLSIGGTITSWFIIDRFGRRAVTFYGVGSLGVVNILTAALGIKRYKPYTTASAAFMTMYNFFYNSGVGPLSYLLASEIPTSKLRGKTISVAFGVSFAFQCLWQFVLPDMFNPDKANMGSSINFIFAGCCFVGLFYFYFCLPETANKSFEEIDELYLNNVSARKSKNYKSQLDEKNDMDAVEYKAQVDHLEDTDSANKA